jgi:hypothetical protein
MHTGPESFGKAARIANFFIFLCALCVKTFQAQKSYPSSVDRPARAAFRKKLPVLTP